MMEMPSTLQKCPASSPLYAEASQPIASDESIAQTQPLNALLNMEQIGMYDWQIGTAWLQSS